MAATQQKRKWRKMYVSGFDVFLLCAFRPRSCEEQMRFLGFLRVRRTAQPKGWLRNSYDGPRSSQRDGDVVASLVLDTKSAPLV